MTLSELVVKITAKGVNETKNAVKATGDAMNKTADAAKHMGGAIKTAGGTIFDMAAKLGELTAGLATVSVGVGLASAALAGVLGNAAIDTATKIDSLTRGLASVSTGAEDLTAQLAAARDLAKLPGLGFSEAVQGKINLEAVGLAASLADRSLMAFGNALASVGKGKADLEGVSTALTQIVSKGVVSAEEIGQLAERVPQIRTAMMNAFGTADTKELQGMAISTTEFIEGVVAELEKLPKVTGGAQNAMENFADRWQQVLTPLGTGLLAGLTALSPTIDRWMDLLEDRFTRVGEIIAAVGNSGVLEQVATKVTDAFESMFGGDFTQAAVNGVATVLSVVGNIPVAFDAAKTYAVDAFAAITTAAGNLGSYLGAVLKVAGANLATFADYVSARFHDVWETISKAVGKGITLLTDFGSKVAHRIERVLPEVGKGLQAVFDKAGAFGLGLTTGATGLLPGSNTPFPTFQALPAFPGFDSFVPKLPALPDLAGILTSDAAGYAEAIMANLKPLPALPDGLNYGGIPEMQDKAADQLATLTRIERNTKDTADAVSLRRQALGGGELAQVGVTPAELSGGRGTIPGGTRGNIGRDSSTSGLARQLSYIVDRRVQESYNQLVGGRGFRPRTSG